jgi:hypothetical protein
MAFTDHSDLFAAVHENGINATIGQLMLQRPSLFNYATSIFAQALSSQLCVPITVPPGAACCSPSSRNCRCSVRRSRSGSIGACS